MKKSRPNELAFALSVHADCPIYASEFEGFVTRTYHAQFMKRVPQMLGVPYLRIDVWCVTGAALIPFTVVAQFEQFNTPYARATPLGPSYDASGAAPYYQVREQTIAVVRAALNDHISAKFDL
jgi:hypothetical protein